MSTRTSDWRSRASVVRDLPFPRPRASAGRPAPTPGADRLSKTIDLAAEPYAFDARAGALRAPDHRHAARFPRTRRLRRNARQRRVATAPGHRTQSDGCWRRGAPQAGRHPHARRVIVRTSATCRRPRRSVVAARRRSAMPGRWAAFSFAARPGTTSFPSSTRCRRAGDRQARQGCVLRDRSARHPAEHGHHASSS